MRNAPDLSHQRIVRALEKAGFVVRRQRKHIVMYSEARATVAIIPRHNPVKRATLLQLLNVAGVSLDEFMELV